MLFVKNQEILPITVLEKTKKTDIVVIGEKDKYEPLSRAVFYKKMKKDK
jgi:thymidine kinase